MTHGTEQCRFERPQMKVFEKTVQKQATLWITVGKRTGFEPLFGPFLNTFLKKSLNFFDLVLSRYSDPSGDFAPLPCTVYLVYTAILQNGFHVSRSFRLDLSLIYTGAILQNSICITISFV